MQQEISAARVTDLIERLGRLLRSRGYAENLNPAQWEALRYLDRCNTHSNNPTSLAGFLGATKGTVSQTVSALERKGLIRKVPRSGQGRALAIILTDRGRAVLTHDPLAEVEAAVRGLDGELPTLANGLECLLAELQESAGLRSFGRCRTCQHFGDDGNPYRCQLLGGAISENDADCICAEHVPQ